MSYLCIVMSHGCDRTMLPLLVLDTVGKDKQDKFTSMLEPLLSYIGGGAAVRAAGARPPRRAAAQPLVTDIISNTFSNVAAP